ncbi:MULTISPECIES: hypothetical protein [Streptomyces]|uniref:hypothetical protein n=1 Tax=Streptomyces TaxID=1883 RepID=UPI00240E6304|nr:MULTISPECIES: hypothetical protein [Streptomyces]WFB88036.1 hypothetical protein MMU79_34655 [Streptomyces olivaceus]WGK47639.1 hypothetical protein M6G09_19765 [Streptomyces sp. B146]
MPRGRHRHSPPLHRLLPPSAIAGVSIVCALGPWLFSETLILRVLAAAAAVTAVVGAVVMRHWDVQAGRQVADLTRVRASDEWRFEERVAELESDLEESRELRQKLEHRLRAKRTELAGLRNEHASLLRRYATAETERASALEGRRLLEIEAVPQTPALPAARPAPEGEGQGSDEGDAPAEGAVPGAGVAGAGGAVAGSEGAEEGEESEEGDAVGGVADEGASDVFSPEGSRLFLRASAALARFADDAPADSDRGDRDGDDGDADEPDGGDRDGGDAPEPRDDGDDGDDGGDGGGGRTPAEAGQEDEAQGQSEGADGHERTDASPATPSDERTAQPTQPTQPTRRAHGHFTVPTAVAVVPAAPARRPVEGEFDFFGTKPVEDMDAGDAPGSSGAALETVQNEDLADVVGQEALAVHKAESETAFKPAGEESRDVSQVIDLTAHDETERIDMDGLRSAVS